MSEGLDRLRETDENNFQVSRERVGDAFVLVNDLNQAYALLAELIKLAGVGPTNDVALGPLFLLNCRYLLNFGMLACLRGHITDSMVYLRRAIDACGYAARIKREPALGREWMKWKPPERIPAPLRQKFRSIDLFPATDPLLRELHKRWKYCSEHTHPSMTAFSRSASAGIADGMFRTRVALCELGDEAAWEPLNSFLWVADTHVLILRVFGCVFEAVVSTDPAKWNIQVNAVEARILNEWDKLHLLIERQQPMDGRRFAKSPAGLWILEDFTSPGQS